MVQKILLLIQATILVVSATFAQPSQKEIVKAFYLGHSLSDGIPELLWGLTQKTTTTAFDYGYQRINGTPLRHQWNQLLLKTHPEYMDVTDKEMLKVFDSSVTDEASHQYRFFSPQNGIPTGQYTHLVLTESVPRYHAEGWGNIEDTYRYADSFYQYAQKYNPAIKPYLYEVWHCINSGTPTACPYDKDSKPFRQRLTADLAMWESVISRFNAKNPRHKMQLIPVGQALGNLSDAIDRKEIPGVKSIREFFTDDIHVNDTLRYFNACVHYATLYNRSPVGLTNEPLRLDGKPFVRLSKELATRLQTIAWQSVQKYSASKGGN